MILYKKLLEIDKNRKKKFTQNYEPILNFKKKSKEIHVQNEIKALAQENLFILKRLLERNSNINNRKLKQDFEKNQEYKNIICNFPSINFYSNKQVNEPIIKSFNLKDKDSNNKSIFPTIYKMSSLQFRKRKTNYNRLDEQYYKNAKKTLKTNPSTKNENFIEEKKSSSGSGSGSGNGSLDEDEKNNGSGDGSDSGSRNGSEDKESSKDN